jgi:sulfonate transport system substrate-binding protein
MPKIKIGGVPEHFNYPWHYAIDNHLFADSGIELSWQNFPGGTGAMITALEKNEIDFALLLTEGAVKSIANGANFKIVGPFVESPLIWGIHTHQSNKKTNLSNLGEMQYAISRMGSGSHLMAFVHAHSLGQEISTEQLVVVNDIQGALNSLANYETDLFFWEKYTTKPFVDRGELKRIAEFPTPWPCFVLAASHRSLSDYQNEIETIKEIIQQTISHLLQDTEKLCQLIGESFHLAHEDVLEWMGHTRWATESTISESDLQNVVESLSKLGLIYYQTKTENLVYNPLLIAHS